jgi:CRISPR-associated protein Csb2
MFALALRYLNGWAMAAVDGARKQHAEWPPHPDRVFMALAAAWFETDADPLEGAALKWLESLAPPALAVSDASFRALVTSYVPVNDSSVASKLPVANDLAKLKDAGLALVPEFRKRVARAFPVAIPHDPTAHLIWRDADPGPHRVPLERLATKLTHVGSSASFVQAWVEAAPPPPNWVPTAGIATHRLRISGADRLAYLAQRANRSACDEWSELQTALRAAKALLNEMVQAPRAIWNSFPDVVILSAEADVKTHPRYAAAKAGDAGAAADLIGDLVSDAATARVRDALEAHSPGTRPTIISAHAYETGGVNAIPSALAELLASRLSLRHETRVVQVNVVAHTGADGYGRLARQAVFDGPIVKGDPYVLVDDFVGQGGTLTNLRGYIHKHGGKVVAATTLTGKPYSARLVPFQEQLDELRRKHGREFERWWKRQFGHTFDCLTQSEARYLAQSPDVDTIRDRLAAAQRPGGGRGLAKSRREQKQEIDDLESRLAARYPQGAPLSLRPEAGLWQGYAPAAPEPRPALASTLFDPSLVIFALRGRSLHVPITLRLTSALRGMLMAACPQQPPPEWLSGHDADGAPSKCPHAAFLPLAFVGAPHADGRILGLAVALPAALAQSNIGPTLGPFLHDPATGQPLRHRLFDGKWFDVELELATRETPSLTLSRSVWCGVAQTWASVTPIVLDRHDGRPGRAYNAEQTVREACARIGLPSPVEVELRPVSRLTGVPHAREFPNLSRKADGGRRFHTHATLWFDVPVRGPVIVGAGRFRGYGVCRPLLGPDPRNE